MIHTGKRSTVNEVFSKKWFIATVAGWIVLLVLDEIAYYWWKDINPGSQFSGILIKHPIQQPGTATS